MLLTHTNLLQAAALLKAEVYGVPRPEWASSAAACGREADKVEVPEFQPRKGVKIETDPKVRLTGGRPGFDRGLTGVRVDQLHARGADA